METVIRNCDATFALTDGGLNDFVANGLAITVSIAVLLGLPAVTVSVELTPLVVFD